MEPAPPSLAAPAAPPQLPPIKPPAPAGAPPPTPPEGFAANIRLAKYPEDLRATIKEWADANPEQVQAARRGVRSDAQVLADAKALVEEMGGDFAKVQKRWKPGEAWNAETTLAIRGTLRTKTEEVMATAKSVREADSTANQTRLALALQEQARVQEIVHGVTAETGRALRSFRQDAFKALQANDVERMQELLRRIGAKQAMPKIAAQVAQLDLANPVAVNNFLRDMSKPSLWDYIFEIWINSILSGIKSHIINASSNIMQTLGEPVERGAAAGVERVLAPLQRRPVERFFSEVPADVFGAISGIEEGVKSALFTLKNGIQPAQASKWEFRRTAFKGTVGKIIRAPGTALEAADAMNYAVNYRAALNASIMRQARKEGLRGQALVERIGTLKNAPPEDIVKEAGRLAEYRLFRQEPGTITQAVMDMREKIPPLRFVIPFLRTPVNLFKFGLERSPVGALNPQLWRNLAAKNPEAADQIARVFLGSALAALVAWQFANGRITGRAPTNQAERDRFYREGKQAFAVRIGDTWVQYQRLEPFNQVFAQVAAAVDAINAKDKTAKEKTEAAITTMGQNLVSQTYLSGLNDLINVITEPERYGSSFLGRLAGSALPFSAAIRTAAQATDRTIRKPRTVAESLQAGVPGLSQRVPPSLTAFGQEAPRQSAPYFPINITRAQQSAVDAELARLGKGIGFVGNTIAGVKLSREEQQRYQVLAGQATYEGLTRLMALAAYPAATDAAKEKAIDAVVSDAREGARARLQQAFPVPGAAAPKASPAPAERSITTATPTPVKPATTTTADFLRLIAERTKQKRELVESQR